MHLLGTDEIPAILQMSARVQALRAENIRLHAANAELEAKIARIRGLPAQGFMRALRRLLGPRST